MAKGKEKRKTVRQRDGATYERKNENAGRGKVRVLVSCGCGSEKQRKKDILIRLFFRTTHEIARYMVKKGHENSAHRWVSGDLVLLLLLSSVCCFEDRLIWKSWMREN